MIKRYTEYREMQQLRKDHLRKQKMRNLLIFSAIIFPLMIVLAVVDVVVSPDQPAKSAVSTVSAQKQEETRHDSFEWTSKQAKFCLEFAQIKGQKEPGVTRRYDACIDETQNWSMGDFE